MFKSSLNTPARSVLGARTKTRTKQEEEEDVLKDEENTVYSSSNDESPEDYAKDVQIDQSIDAKSENVLDLNNDKEYVFSCLKNCHHFSFWLTKFPLLRCSVCFLF